MSTMTHYQMRGTSLKSYTELYTKGLIKIARCLQFV